MPKSRFEWACRVLLACAAAAGGAAAHAGGDAARGAGVFKAECAECHSVKEGRHKKGPTLFQVVHRPAAQLPGFAYSDSLKSTGWIWDEPQLRAYLNKPASASNPGGKMKYEGLRDQQALEDLIAYLQTLR